MTSFDTTYLGEPDSNQRPQRSHRTQPGEVLQDTNGDASQCIVSPIRMGKYTPPNTCLPPSRSQVANSGF